MSSSSTTPTASELFREHQLSVYRRTDRIFAILMVVQWIAGVVAAIWISPETWSGTSSMVHPHVLAALVLGAIIAAFPIILALTRPGETITRHVVAVSQILFSALLIHLTGGRIETHFHVFGSLAFLACYRDWRVLISATIVVIVDHVLRGIFWPYSVYGVLHAAIWRSLEHGGWVLFEDMFLLVAIRQSLLEMWNVAIASEAQSATAAELQKSEEALRDQTQILESVLTSMGDGVIVADQNGHFLVFNPAAHEILEKGRSDVPLEAWSEEYHLFQSDTTTPFPAHDLPLSRAIRGDSTDTVELVIRHEPSSELHWISVTGRPLRDSSDALRGGVIVFRDITTAKHTEAALHEAKRAAETANASKSEFLANMSHEIRTPLNSILGYTDLIRRGQCSTEETKVFLETINASGRHLATLIDDVLDLSKIEAGHMDIEYVRCSPHRIITEVLSVLRVRAQEKALSLECQWSSKVPETILTDPARFRQMLMNIVGNAIKFTETGEIRLQAAVEPDATEPRLLIQVRDTGIGIANDRIEKIFRPFEQADSSITRRFGGTGLGLAICQHIAHRLGGGISVESTPGKGSTVSITLATGSLEDVTILDSPPSEAFASVSTPKAEAPRRLTGYRVLLVEDGEINRELISFILRDAGATVACAGNGVEGLDVEAQQEFDIILMDMQMPVMDGYTASRRLRERGCKLPIVALTAHAMRGDREKCIQAGCSAYQTKPIQIDALVRTVADALCGDLPLANELAGTDLLDEQDSELALESLPPIFSTLPQNNPRFQEILEAFVDRLRGKIEEMRTAHQESNWQTLAELAHWLHGSGGMMGLPCFSEPARRLERGAKVQAQGIGDMIDEIEGLARRVALPATAK